MHTGVKVKNKVNKNKTNQRKKKKILRTSLVSNNDLLIRLSKVNRIKK